MEEKVKFMCIYEFELGEYFFFRFEWNIKVFVIFRGVIVGVEYVEVF